MRWQQLVEQGCEQLGMSADVERIAALEVYIRELLRWNRQTNLTAITDPVEVARKHILDCLAAMPTDTPRSLCDVGSGAGLPGLLWAREWPATSVVSIDARQRKVAFQNHIARLWKLDHFEARHERVEEESQRFELVTFRAFAALDKALSLVGHLVAPGGKVRALKGPGAAEELKAVDERCWSYTMSPLAVPGLDAQRFIIELTSRAEAEATEPPCGP